MIYRRLIGLALLWAIVPLPFLYIILPPFWITGILVAGLLVGYPQSAPQLPRIVQNLIGIIIVVLVVMVGGWHVGPIRPLGHLLLLLTSISVLNVKNRSGFQRNIPAVFLVWVIAVASSTHIGLALYLAFSTAFWWWFGMRILLLDLGNDTLPRIKHAIVAAVIVTLLAVPIFIAMPRLRSPWISGESSFRSTGFSTSVKLGQSGSIEENHEPAIMMTAPEDEKIEALWSRLRATALTMVFAGSWESRFTDLTANVPANEMIYLNPTRTNIDGLVQLEIEVFDPERYVFIPTGTVATTVRARTHRDSVGGIVIGERMDGPLSYTVWVAHEPIANRASPVPGETYLPKDNHEVDALAHQIAGRLETPAAQAVAIERYLSENYQYTLDIPRGDRSDPVAWFLLHSRQGHCEFFGGAMVVLLRHLGIPARLVAGYNGGSLDPSGNAAVIRQANAHSWVEAWLSEDEGWITFDPTPAEGVPSLENQTTLQQLSWAWERIQDTWDRYIVTFGLGEQMGIITALGEMISLIPPLIRAHWLIWAVVVIASLSLLIWLGKKLRFTKIRSSRLPAADAIERLAKRLHRHGIEVPRSASPRSIGKRAAARWPELKTTVRRLVEMAEGELYAGLGPTPKKTINSLWKQVVAHSR